jgi:hypothetical protein
LNQFFFTQKIKSIKDKFYNFVKNAGRNTSGFFKLYFLIKTKIQIKTKIKTNIKNKNYKILLLNFKTYEIKWTSNNIFSR